MQSTLSTENFRDPNPKPLPRCEKKALGDIYDKRDPHRPRLKIAPKPYRALGLISLQESLRRTKVSVSEIMSSVCMRICASMLPCCQLLVQDVEF